MLWTGPTISICWLVTALLDSMDGSIARATDTTSQMGEVLDHKLLDPMGAWMALLAARQEDQTVEGFDFTHGFMSLNSTIILDNCFRLLDLLCLNGTCCGYLLV